MGKFAAPPFSSPLHKSASLSFPFLSFGDMIICFFKAISDRQTNTGAYKQHKNSTSNRVRRKKAILPVPSQLPIHNPNTDTRRTDTNTNTRPTTPHQHQPYEGGHPSTFPSAQHMKT